MSDEQDISELLRLLRSDTGFARLKQGVIAGLDGDTCSVLLSEGGSAAVPGVRWLKDGYQPFPGDTVFLLKNGADMFVLGRTVGDERGTALFSESTNALRAHAARSVHTLDTVVEADPTVVLSGSQVVPLYPGLYRVSVTPFWVSDATGMRGVYIMKNGTEDRVVANQGATPSEGTAMHGARLIRFNGETDYFEIETNQTSGGSLNGRILDCSVQWLRR
jgi:hypothetical protein